MSEFDDKPIESPEEDKFGFKVLAKTIADSISKMTAPEGTVIAVNGPWGSGKSSLINLIKKHLSDQTKTGDLKIVDFKCWWFRGQEALTIAFFRELYSAMESSEAETKKAISELGAQLLVKTSPLIGAMTNLAVPGAGSTVSGLTEFVASLIAQDKTVEKLHEEICDKLHKGSKRYLIIIDDIDRLSPDEAMLIFQLVKSVGGLPNVMYLLAYDRQLAEKIVRKRYPSEGPHYLEKIVQASFELPEPSRVSLEKEFLRRLDNVIEERDFGDGVYFRNLFDEIIAPEIKTPRDLLRILNPLKVTWPVVKGEVDPAEFLSLETLRIQRPKLYATLRSHKILLTGSVQDISFPARKRLEEERSFEQCNKIFLESEPPSEHKRLRDGLTRLFPELTGAWTDVNHIESHPDRDRQHRVCSPRHFETYFRFSLSEHQISMCEIKTLIENADDFDYIRHSFLDAAEISLTNGFTRATLLLQELAIRTDHIPENLIGDLLKAIYSTADRLIEREGINMLDGTMPQLIQFTRKLTLERLPLETRSEVLRKACEQAALGYLACIATSAYGHYFPTENNSPKRAEECLTTKNHALELKDLAVKRIREAKANSSLIDCPVLDRVLFLWIRVDEEEVRSWISGVIDNNTAVARLAKAFIGLVQEDLFQDPATLTATALRGKLGHVVDLDEFSSHADRAIREGNLEAKDHEALRIFLSAWRRQENHNNNAEDK